MASKLSFAICIFILSIYCRDGHGASVVTYFQNAGFKGDQFTLEMDKGTCYKLSFFNDRISSINTHGNCVDVFIDAGCKGATFRIGPGTTCHNNLGDCGLNDSVSSLRLC